MIKVSQETIEGTVVTNSKASAATGSRSRTLPLEPPLPGVMPGRDKARLIFAQDIDYPPYAYLASPPEGDFTIAGFGHDVAMGLEQVCPVEVTVVQTKWSDCWHEGVWSMSCECAIIIGMR